MSVAASRSGPPVRGAALQAPSPIARVALWERSAVTCPFPPAPHTLAAAVRGLVHGDLWDGTAAGLGGFFGGGRVLRPARCRETGNTTPLPTLSSPWWPRLTLRESHAAPATRGWVERRAGRAGTASNAAARNTQTPPSLRLAPSSGGVSALL